MQDPTRIPPVAALLQRAWEAQPQLGFAEFFARLAARGIARNSSDAELADALRAELSVHPWSFEGCHGALPERDSARAEQRDDAEASPGGATGATRTDTRSATDTGPASGATSTITARARIELEPAGANTSKTPERLVTIDPEWIVVRPASTRNPMQPTVWRYEAIQRCRPGEPLRVRSEDGVVHQLGIVRLITVLEPAARGSAAEPGQESEPNQPDLSGMTFAQWQELGAPEFLLRFDSGATAIVGSALRVTTVARREVQHSSFPWDAIRAAAIGGPLVVQFPPGAAGGMGAADPTGAASTQPGATGAAGAQPGAMGAFGATRAMGAARGATQPLSELGAIELCMRI